MATRRKLALLWISLLDLERLDVDEDGEGVGDENICGEDLNVVAVDKRPELVIWAQNPGSSGACDEDEECGQECCEQLAVPNEASISTRPPIAYN